jgi:hypothetical protein
LICHSHLPDYREQDTNPLDIVGVSLFGSGIALLSYVLEIFGDHSLGHGEILGLLALSLPGRRSYMMERATTMVATRGPGALMRSDVVACIAHVRAFAIMLAGDRRRAEDLVRDTIEQTSAAANRPGAGVDLKVQMFAVLHRLRFAHRSKGLRNSGNRPRARRMVLSQTNSSAFSAGSATSSGKR